METKERLILISNDDGVNATGIAALIDVAKNFGKIIVVAPATGQSGMSHSISISKALYLNKIKDDKDIEIYSCSGTPVDSIKLAIHDIIPRKPDLILSGINHGSNSSISVLYSGTMGAAIEGRLNGVPSIGFSLLDHSENPDFTLSKKIVSDVLSSLFSQEIPANLCLNINVPNIDEKDFMGIKICRQTNGVWKEGFDKKSDEKGAEYFTLTGSFDNFEPEAKDTDEWALNNKYASIVPVKVDFTNYSLLDKLNYFEK